MAVFRLSWPEKQEARAAGKQGPGFHHCQAQVQVQVPVFTIRL